MTLSCLRKGKGDTSMIYLFLTLPRLPSLTVSLHLPFLETTFEMLELPNPHNEKASPAASTQPQGWQTRSWRHFPVLILLSLFGVLVAIGLALLVLVLADGSLVENWPLAPTVYLSISATLANTMLRFAFSESADLFWWSRLLSPSGTTLSELHAIWELKHNAFSLLRFHRDPTERQYFRFRFTALLVLILATNGPLLQRAVTVDLATRVSVHDGVKLPIRREPMWNFTTKIALPLSPFQDEVSEIYTEINQARPPALPYSVCSPNATCSASVTVAGFSWTCNEFEIPIYDVPSIVMVWVGFGNYCNATGRNAEADGCDIYNTCYQASFLDPNNTFYSRAQDTGGIPWVNGTLPPQGLNYSSYIQHDVAKETLSVRQCNISSAFVELPIVITDERHVTLPPTSYNQASDRGVDLTRSVESIPMPIAGGPWSPSSYTMGFQDIMKRLFEGYILQNPNYGILEVAGPRQYINQSSVRFDPPPPSLPYAPDILKFSCVDPIDDAYSMLNDMSLRYAIKSIPSTPERLALEKDLHRQMGWEGGKDLRHKIRSLMKTKFTKAQVVDNYREERTVAVYSAHYFYTALAVAVTYAATFLVLLLLRGVFSSHGRQFSMSPLEIAKAFDAPLLDSLGSNSTGSELAKQAPSNRIKYGEANLKDEQMPLAHPDEDEDRTSPAKKTAPRYIIQQDDAPSSTSTVVESEDVEGSVISGGAQEQTRLLVDVAERVSQPSDGRYYA